jgi:hypothetical protein
VKHPNGHNNQIGKKLLIRQNYNKFLLKICTFLATMKDTNNGKSAINENEGGLSPSLNCTDVNIPPTEGVIDLEVVGINGISNGQSCCQHSCCGASLSANELLRLVKCVVTINKKTEEAVKLLRVTADDDGCTIYFLPCV